MYLHLGQEVVVRKRDIVGVFDMDNTTVSGNTKEFLNEAEREKRVTYVSYELPKSFVVCSPCRKAAKPRQDQVYVAQMAPATLKKRHNSGEV